MPQTPINLTIPHACDRWGTSRSYLYRLAGEGKIIFRKSGRRTLVDVESGDKYSLSLPAAKIKAPAHVQMETS
jgi:excisionase family DNA binding protein